MSTLTLVRHGQARPFEKDSDRLSELGERQAAMLHEYWMRHGIRFDLAVTGSLLRQRQTAALAGYPDAQCDEGWNEYDAGAILAQLAPALASADADFADRRAEFDAMAKGPDRNRYFQRMLETLMDAWLEGRVASSSVESFEAYRERVTAARKRIVEADAASRNVVVFTSGGPIGLCIQSVLGAPDAAFLDVNWRVRNASITEFTFSRGRISLDSFNVLSHLDDRSLWSWR